MKEIPVTIVMPMKNAATTVVKALRSVEKQSYPVKKIIVIDNNSSDTSVATVREYAANSSIPIDVIARTKNYGVSESFNVGVKRARTRFVVLMHSDSFLPGKHELKKLLEPMLHDAQVVATGPILLHPRKLWNSYNFWLKLLFMRVVDTEIPSGNGKFDALRRDAFLKIGGFDATNYGHQIGVGGEDGDLHVRLARTGTIVISDARVVHLHYLNDDYRLSDFIANRKLLARSYGRLIKMRGFKIGPGGLRFLIKPLLCCIPAGMVIAPASGLLLAAYLVWYPWNMYAAAQTRSDIRIVTIPFIMLYLLYAETYWMLSTLLTDSVDNIA